MEIKYPDYDRSILSVAASVLRHYGADDCPHKTLPELDELFDAEPKNIIVMLFDGLGSSSLQYHLPEDSFLRKNKCCDISSVFPPTTTAATTTVQSGYSPLEHSWLGWNLYFKEIDDTVSVLWNKSKKTGKKIRSEHIGNKYIPFKSIFDRIKEADSSVTTHYLSTFSDEKVFTVGAAMRRIRKISKKPGRQYIYLYWYEPDHTMHSAGVNDKSVGKLVSDINRQVEKLCSEISDSVAVMIADHGLIDVKWEYLEDYPELDNMLLRAPSVEPRAAAMFVKDGMKDDFRQEFNRIFGDRFMLLTKEEAYEKQLFGPGTPGYKTEDFIGDFIAVAISDVCLAQNREMPTFRANHAGLTKDEMTVPLVTVKRA